ncbi:MULTISPECIES: ATP-binding protein [unclassified Pseudodesulfovibrio]|uniref:ATP-binding protein n=1 Tax=unclassified Pseudodesulfovibrio TaxID=2661612 RepID=UPI000FEB7201|nr:MULTISPECIES: ATP-binding protein [unclassified Pseudodesulfovibrio]MCJ2165124.1 ATP-binding protein [Pseudodesulfovibrio sp. S3-i]RWU03417.1 (4Fe-4S)-binding protein [Pseudodesulfovibrio sp. S3]
MREIVIISGKGGAGKTSVAGAFAHLADNAILCDLDVDAPDLHLLLNPQIDSEKQFWSGFEAIIDQEKCINCGQCATLCRFDAITEGEDGFKVNPFACEGCKVCVTLCPEQAIDFPEKHCGQWYVSQTRFGPMVHAQLFPGEENSGRLVTLLKQTARTMAEEQGLDLVLCDGAPGIGCPVISSMAGTDLAVVVTEPTPSGLHDLKRVAELCDGFRTKVTVLINKWDINPDMTDQIEAWCTSRGHALAGRFPHDKSVVDAMLKGKVITEFQDNPMTDSLKQSWAGILALLDTCN